MRAILLLGLFIGLCSTTASAQTDGPDPQGFKQHLRGQYLSSDTAQAIISLYSRRQAGGVSWMLAATLSAARLATAGGNQTVGNGYTVQREAPDVGAVFLLATPILGYGLGKLLHYSNGHLEKILTAYAAGQPLPRSLRRKLKPRFFNQPIVTYKPVPVKAAR